AQRSEQHPSFLEPSALGLQILRDCSSASPFHSTAGQSVIYGNNSPYHKNYLTMVRLSRILKSLLVQSTPTDTADAACARREWSRAHAPSRKSRPPRARCPCQIPRAARRHTCADRDTT